MKSIYFHSAVRHFLLLLLLALSLHSWADASRCFNWYGQNRQTRAKTFFHKSDHLTLTKNVHELLYHYIHAKNEGDPQIAFLEQLGFRFDPSAAIIPTPETILERVEALILQVQNKEGLDSSQIYRPARSFVNKTGDVLWLKSEDIVPTGYLPKYVNLEDKDFYNLKKRGLFPLSDIQSEGLSISNVSLFLHDLGHIGVYIRNPKVMALDRQIIERRGPIMGDFGEYLSETLVWANHDHGAELAAHLQKFGFLKDSHLVTKNEILDQLKNMDNHQIDELLKGLFKNKFRWYRFLGGTNADVVDLRNSGERKLSLGTESTGLNYLFSLFEKTSLEPLTIDEAQKNIRWIFSRNALLDPVAAHLTQVILTLNYPVESFFQDLAKSENYSTQFTHLLINSGSYFYPEHRLPPSYKK